MSAELWLTQWVSWPAFVLSCVLLGLLYLLVRYLSHTLASGLYLREADSVVRAFVRVFALLLDPLILLMLIALFVGTKPLIHGLTVLLVALFGFRQIRDYVSGRVLRFDDGVQVGRHLVFGQYSGVINAFGLTGLYLQRESGRTRLSYHELLKTGYSVAADPRRSAWYHLRIREQPVRVRGAEPLKTSGKEQTYSTEVMQNRERLNQLSRQLRYILLENPYAQQGFRIEPLADQSEGPVVELDVGVYRAEHIQHLIWQLEEAGFSASLIQR